MNTRISATEWKFDLPSDRVEQLNAALESYKLLELLILELRSSAHQARFCWQGSYDEPGCSRVKASAPCSPAIYDWLINGPTGYRAHYYASEERGETFNNLIVGQITSVLVKTCPSWGEIRRLHRSSWQAVIARTLVETGV